MTPTERHALEKLLADVAGVEVKEHVDEKCKSWVYLLRTRPWEHWDIWEPFNDANQMELVKAGLRQAKAVYETKWMGELHATTYRRMYVAKVYNDIVALGLKGATIHERKDPESEAMAFALAVKAWKESQ